MGDSEPARQVGQEHERPLEYTDEDEIALVAIVPVDLSGELGDPFGDHYRKGRLAAIADVFDALSSKRPYKEPWPVEKVVELLIAEKGKHFDPELVDLFLSILPEIEDIMAQYPH